MSTVASLAQIPRDPVAVPDPREALAQALRAEARLLRELTVILSGHRRALIEGDPEGAEVAVFRSRRVLGTVAQARVKRERLMARAMGSRDWSLDELADVPGVATSDELQAASADLRSAMLDLDDTLATSRRMLELER